MLYLFRNLKERLLRGTVKGHIETESWDATTTALYLSTAWFILEITVQHFCNYLCLFIVLMENLICG